MTKAGLRKIHLAKQKNLSTAERTALSQRIAQTFFSSFDLSRIKTLHCFIPIEKFKEIDTSLIFKRLWRDFPLVETCVPRVDFASGTMRHLKFTPDTAVDENVWDISEPIHDEFVESTRIDMVLVPLLCFDRKGYRVGYGKGFYDRFLKNCRPDCLKVGLSYFAPVAGITDTGGFDVKLDRCVTPAGIFATGAHGKQ